MCHFVRKQLEESPELRRNYVFGMALGCPRGDYNDCG